MIIKEQINVKDDRLIDGLTPVVRIMGQVEGAADRVLGRVGESCINYIE